MFSVERLSAIPIYEQITAQAERFVLLGLLQPGDALPSVRALSQTLSVNPNTLQKAYADLERRGLCYSVPGTGRFVAPDARERLLNEQEERLYRLEELCGELAMYRLPLETVLARAERGYRAGQEKGADRQ